MENFLKALHKTLRYRAECLIFSEDGNRIYLCKSKENDERNRTYYLPVCSAELTKHIEEQLRDEIREANKYRNFNNTKIINNDSELIHYIEDLIKEDEIGAKIAGLDKILHPSFFNNGFARIIKFEDKNAGVITLQSTKKKLDEKVYYVRVYVKPDYRGLGLARKALNIFSQEITVDVLIANIASDNESSKSSHLKNGFRRANANEEIKYGVKNNIREMYIRYEKEFVSDDTSLPVAEKVGAIRYNKTDFTTQAEMCMEEKYGLGCTIDEEKSKSY